ncbi:MAG: cell division protein ZipA [Pseudomonadota bacterium]|nr:cell division protein ZipA [Pseudomonadota bacterium]
MGVSTIIVISVIASAIVLFTLYVWLGQRQQQKSDQLLREIAERKRAEETVKSVGNKRVIVDPSVVDDVYEEEFEIKTEPAPEFPAEPEPELVLQPANVTTETQAPAENLSFITFAIMADKGQTFGGYDLLQALLGAGLRHGENQIFHRYDTANKDQILFSLASIAKPGTFPVDNMGGFSTPGLIVIYQLDAEGRLLEIFEKVLQTTQQLAEELSGYVLDDQRQQLSIERTQWLRQQLRQQDQRVTAN